jgi:hypothetical protein
MLFDACLDTCLPANGVILASASFIKFFYLSNITWPKSTSLQSNVSQRMLQIVMLPRVSRIHSFDN